MFGVGCFFILKRAKKKKGKYVERQESRRESFARINQTLNKEILPELYDEEGNLKSEEEIDRYFEMK